MKWYPVQMLLHIFLSIFLAISCTYLCKVYPFIFLKKEKESRRMVEPVFFLFFSFLTFVETRCNKVSSFTPVCSTIRGCVYTIESSSPTTNGFYIQPGKLSRSSSARLYFQKNSVKATNPSKMHQHTLRQSFTSNAFFFLPLKTALKSLPKLFEEPPCSWHFCYSCSVHFLIYNAGPDNELCIHTRGSSTDILDNKENECYITCVIEGNYKAYR